MTECIPFTDKSKLSVLNTYVQHFCEVGVPVTISKSGTWSLQTFSDLPRLTHLNVR